MTDFESEQIRILRQIRTGVALVACIACVGLLLFFWPEAYTWLLDHRPAILWTLLVVGIILLLPLIARMVEAIFKPQSSSHRAT